MEIEYCETQKEDFKGLCSLFEICFGKVVQENYWEWKYKRGYSILAKKEGKVVGHYGGIFFDFKYKNKIFKIVQATDLMTSPEVRHLVKGKSVLLNLAKIFFKYCYENNIAFAYGFPGEKSRLLGEKFLNYKPLWKVFYYSYEIKKPNKLYPLEPFYFLNYEIKEIIKSKKDRGFIRDLDYFKWRYIENPLFYYYIAQNGGSFFIFKINEDGAILMDWAYKNIKEAKDLLISLDIEKFKSFPLELEIGENFLKIEENYYLEYKPLNLDPKNFLNERYFKPSDYDAF